MAGDAVVGALRVVLGADTAKFEDGLKSASSSLLSFGRQVLSIAGGIQLQKTLEQAVRSFAALTKSGLETADTMGKLAQRVGVPIEQLTGLAHAADLADVSAEALGKSFNFLSKNMVATASGATTAAASAFQFLGIQVSDASGKLKSSDQVMAEVADAFAKMEDGASKTALALAIFGKSGAELIPLLNQGAAGIERMKEEAKALGLVVTADTARAAESFNDSMRTLGKVSSGVALQLTATFAPALAKVAEGMVDWVKSSQVVKTVSEGLARTIIFLSDNTKILVEALKLFITIQVVTTLVGMTGAMITFTKAVVSAGTAMAVLNAIKTISISKYAALAAIVIYATGQTDKFIEFLKSLGDTINGALPENFGDDFIGKLKAIGINVDALKLSMSELGQNINTFVGPTLEQAGKKISDLGKAFDPEAAAKTKAFNDELTKISLHTREVQGAFDGLAPGLIQAAQQLKLIDENGQGLTDRFGNLMPKVEQLNDALLTLRGAQLTQENLAPWQLFEQQLDRINLLYAAGAISAETAAAASRKAAEDTGQAWDLAASKMTGDLASGLKAFAAQNKSLAGAAKAAAIAQALINTYTAATKALATYPPPLSYAAAAAAVVAGLGYVSQIQSQSFAKGGSFVVPGGISGVDTRMVPLNLAAGERVDITPANMVRNGEGPATVRLTGSKIGDIFTRERLRDFFDLMNDAHADGYKLVME